MLHMCPRATQQLQYITYGNMICQFMTQCSDERLILNVIPSYWKAIQIYLQETLIDWVFDGHFSFSGLIHRQSCICGPTARHSLSHDSSEMSGAGMITAAKLNQQQAKTAPRGLKLT